MSYGLARRMVATSRVWQTCGFLAFTSTTALRAPIWASAAASPSLSGNRPHSFPPAASSSVSFATSCRSNRSSFVFPESRVGDFHDAESQQQHPFFGSMANPVNQRVASEPERIAEDLERPELDNRTYRVIRLPNELEALLIHDPDTDKASAAMDVNVGAFSDPDSMPGMAHAVEHLLFMGTEKYPIENEYNTYLSTNNGHSNAFTASCSTNYYFELGASSTPTNSRSSSATNLQNASAAAGRGPLFGALDRFAQFFVKPLFLAGTLDRELRAVDSENKKNLQSDTWRLYQLQKSLSNPKHPFHKFSTGNLQTLKEEPLKDGLEIRKEFINFYEKHYSANRMKLTVLGQESLDELQEWVVELFSDVKNKKLSPERWDDAQPFAKDQLLTQIFGKPVMDSRVLDIWFPYPDEDELYESQPSRYLSHLLGHEGPGSLLAYIKNKGWANSLGAGEMPVCPGASFMTVSIRLTEDGLKHYQEVLKALFQYIAILNDQPPQQWIVDEMRTVSEVEFRFKQKSPASRTTSALSTRMQKPFLPRKLLLSGESVIRKFDPEAIARGLRYLRPDNFRIAIVSQQYPGDWDSKERWYGTEYKYQDIPEDLRETIRKAAASKPADRPKELHLPHKNEFIPTRLDVEKVSVEEPAKRPVLIRHDENVRVWFKKDDMFWVPKANLKIFLRSPLVALTPRTSVMTHLYRELVQDALSEYAYDAEIAGLEYDLVNHSAGLDIALSGYNDKLSVLLEKVLLACRDLEFTDQRFDIIKERVYRGFRNWDLSQPYNQVGHYSRWLTKEDGWINEQYVAELPSITAADIRGFFPSLLAQLHVELLVHGNLYKEDALKLSDVVEATLKPESLPVAQWKPRRSLMLAPKSNYIFSRTLQDPHNVNHAIEYMLHVSYNRDRTRRAQLMLFGQLTEEPAFDQLRTKEQLGYIVWSGAFQHNTISGYHVIIQSERPTAYLEERIDAFLVDYGKTLEAMEEKEFESFKTSLINKRQEKLKNLGQESGRFWTHISSEFLDFLQVDEDVAHIARLTKPEMLDFYKTYLLPTSPQRAKVSVHMHAKGTSEKLDAAKDSAEHERETTSIEEVAAWKAAQQTTEAARPLRELSEFEEGGKAKL